MDSRSVWIILGVLVLVVVLGVILRGTEAQRLRRTWFRSISLPRGQAEQVLARHLASLRERYPGHTEAWYLRKVLSDLRRDRR